MNKQPSRRPSEISQSGRKILKFSTALMATAGLFLVGVNPVTAEEKPTSPQEPTVIGNVDLNGPHVNSDGSKSTKDLGPCNYLISAVTPLGFGWSGEFRWVACSYWGATNATTKNYQWYVSPQSSSQACAQGMGYVSNKVAIWHYLGCGDQGQTAVLWGNVAAYPKMKFQSLSGLLVPLYWY